MEVVGERKLLTKGLANNHFHQDDYSFSTSPNLGATM